VSAPSAPSAPTAPTALTASSADAADPFGGPVRVGIPAYFYPGLAGEEWRTLLSLPTRSIVIVNPASAPGVAVDPNYVAALTLVAPRRFETFGYVDTDYGRRTAATVVAEAARYRAWYGIDGVFLDQTPGASAQLDAIAAVVAPLRERGFRVAMNPGQPVVDGAYFDLADHVIVFEGPYDDYLRASFPDTTLRQPSSKLWHLVYDVPGRKAMRTVRHVARRRNAGFLYATRSSMPNPWSGVDGAFWAAAGAGPRR
jgi:hypothetical protein